MDAKRYHLIGPAKKKKKYSIKTNKRERKTSVDAEAHIINIIEKKTKAVFTEVRKQKGTHIENIHTLYTSLNNKPEGKGSAQNQNHSMLSKEGIEKLSLKRSLKEKSSRIIK